LCGREGVNDVDSVGEEDGFSAQAGGIAEGCGEVGFSQTDKAKEDDVGFVLDKLKTEEVLDLEAVDFLRPVPAEGVEGFYQREASGFDAAGDDAVLAQGGFAFGELSEVSR
jgi:hypothetical protein